MNELKQNSVKPGKTLFYDNKIASLKDIFGTRNIELKGDLLIVNNRRYPIVDDVIILLEPDQYPPALQKRLAGSIKKTAVSADFAEDIQFTFGSEWQQFPDILPEHREEFSQYFDLVNIDDLKHARVCDLGCGIGRWSYFLGDACRELVLVDFSEAIFVARRNLRRRDNAIFFMADINCLPFATPFADFLFCLGVLHHMPVNALATVRKLKSYSPALLIYLYYSLDNRPRFFQVLLSLVTMVRLAVSHVRNEFFRSVFTSVVAITVYLPLISLGALLHKMNLRCSVPLYEGYRGKTLARIRQDVYDRFFTRIEQRFSKKDIAALQDSFKSVVISDTLPYWHFLCKDN
ncbi:MAG: class I SAM-dependent methyltransferase [Candidatus Omnitrophota bacterium]|jgi:SAM-dependent methyltransferase